MADRRINVEAIAGAVVAGLQAVQQQQSPTLSGNPSTSTSPANENTARNRPMLPSQFIKRKSKAPAAAGNDSKRKKKDAIQTYERDIICIPHDYPHEGGVLTFPRGKIRIELGKQGLIGKVCLQSWMSEDDIRAEIYSCFKKPFRDDPQFPFKYLQSAGTGAKSMIVPAVGDNFQWSAKQVAQMGGSRAVYVWAQKPLMIEKAVCKEDEEDDLFEDDGGTFRIPHSGDHKTMPSQIEARTGSSCCSKSLGTQSQQNYRQYCQLIDLTSCDSDGDNDEAPEPPVHRQTPAPVIARHEVEHILQQHFSRVVTKETSQRINVRRSNLLQDATKQFSRSSFDVSKMLKVCFMGESAVDDGGPRREFFRLLLQELFSTSGLFEGYPDSTLPQHNVMAIAQGQFSMAGKIIATSIVQGGPAPACFSPAAADILVYNEVLSNVKLSDIVDADVRMKMQRISNANSTDDLQAMLRSDDFDFRFDCGFSKPTASIKFEDISFFTRTVWMHYTVYRVHGELQQLRDGLLGTLHFKHLVEAHPNLLWSLLVADKKTLTASFLQEVFLVCYSPQGSNDRVAEEAIVMNFYDYLQDCEDNSEVTGVTLEDIMIFTTGVAHVPPLGFDNVPKIQFMGEQCLPQASTCSLSLKFPLDLISYDTFKDKFTLAILGSVGFGNV